MKTLDDFIGVTILTVVMCHCFFVYYRQIKEDNKFGCRYVD